MNVNKLAPILQSREKTYEWLIEKGLLPGQMHCKFCKNLMHHQKKNGWGRYRCRNRSQHPEGVDCSVTVAKGTWFEKSRMKFEECVLLMYGFAHDWSYDQARQEASFGGTKLSVVSINDWFNECRKVCMCALDRVYQSEQPVGGPERIVHIVEMTTDNYSCDKSRIKEDSLVLAAIDDVSGYRLDTCENGECDVLTIKSFIEKHVAARSIVHTDGSKYDKKSLEIKDYTHVPISYGKKKTENNNWRKMSEFLWRREVAERNLDPFEALMEDISFVYPLNDYNDSNDSSELESDEEVDID